MKLFIGIDIGSTTAKCVIIDENEKELIFSFIPTEYDRNVSGEKILKIALEKIGADYDDIAYVVSTGYGRKSFERANLDIPEIIAHGVGTYYLKPGTRTIIDIGGQDSKVIELNENGNVERFEMNDKCAAGTGRFFEVLTHRLLGIEMEELSDLMKKSENACTISSMCTIFAESEIISYLSQKVPVADIAAGTGKSIARRILSMGRASQIKYEEPIVFSGGVAQNEAIADIFSELLGKKVEPIEAPQSTAALGAAIRARKEYMKAQTA
ncbi:MAG: acyl-CoA dehydratase activase [Oscillospiraceae bacterium]